MRTTSRFLIALLLALALLASFTACKEREKTPGEKLDEALEKAGDKIEEAADEIGDAVEDAADQAKEKAEEVKEKLEEGGEGGS